ncbi:hypothetical protein QCE47_02735 [Caballeronia sp. LZ025]|uniref:hypothetical protein n=1 Tax=Caballeronia TaxID=1827195 RepID=UPI001FD05062|nr:MULTISPECIES: hypothetical protein [Caballeronia]MDR5731266.1 hypothetical protein [Caballeronia sp. LZ025]
MLDKVLIALFSSGMTLSAFALAVWLTRNVLLDAVKGRVKLSYDKQLEATKAQLSSELEVLKAERARDNSVLGLVHKTVTDSMSHVQQRRVESVRAVWEALLTIKNNTPPSLTFLDCLLESEFAEFLQRRQWNQFNLPSREEVEKLTSTDLNDLETHRLFSGEYLWSLYHAYMVIHIRAVFLLLKKVGDGEEKPWYRDTASAQLARSLMTEDEFKQFSNMQFQQLHFVRTLIERKFLDHSNRIMNGEESSSEAMRLASVINTQIAAAQQPAARP